MLSPFHSRVPGPGEVKQLPRITLGSDRAGPAPGDFLQCSWKERGQRGPRTGRCLWEGRLRLAVGGRQAALQAEVTEAPELGGGHSGRPSGKCFGRCTLLSLPLCLPASPQATQALSRGTKRQNGLVRSLGLRTDAALSPSSHAGPCCWDLCDMVSFSSSAAPRQHTLSPSRPPMTAMWLT